MKNKYKDYNALDMCKGKSIVNVAIEGSSRNYDMFHSFATGDNGTIFIVFEEKESERGVAIHRHENGKDVWKPAMEPIEALIIKPKVYYHQVTGVPYVKLDISYVSEEKENE